MSWTPHLQRIGLLGLLGLLLAPAPRPAAADPVGSWTVIFGGQTPGARAYCARAVDTRRNRLVVFGGYPASNEVWIHDLVHGSWARLATTGTPPSPRYGASAIYDPVYDRVIVCGGADPHVYSDSYALSLADGAWTPFYPGTPPMVGRAFHTAVYDPVARRMLVFGGETQTRAFLNDLWGVTLDGAPAWSSIAVPGLAPRSHHAAVFDVATNSMVVVGGEDPGLLSDTWKISFAPLAALRIADLSVHGHSRCEVVLNDATHELVLFGGWWDNMAMLQYVMKLDLADPQRWTIVPGAQPDYFALGPAGAYDRAGNRVLLFGGTRADAPGFEIGETFDFDLASSRWRRREGPVASTEASAVVDSAAGQVLQFGGATASGKSEALSMLVLGDYPYWLEVAQQLPRPSGRSGHGAVWDPLRRRMILFGGDTGNGSYVNERWSFSPDSGWSGPVVDGAGPSARGRHAMMFDPLRDRVLLYGGRNTADLDDLWELRLATNTWNRVVLAPGVRPHPASGATLVYDAKRDRALLFGGRSGNGYYEQIWELTLSGATPRWRYLALPGQVPRGRWLQGAAYDPTIDAMVVYGGEDPFYGPLADVWAFSCSDSTWWELGLDGGAPGPRAGHVFVRDPGHGRFVAINGRSGSAVGPPRRDSWSLSLDAYTAVTVSLAALDVTARGVRIAWYVPGAAHAEARVTRFEDGGLERALGRPRVEGDDRLVLEDPSVAPGGRYRYRIDLTVDGRAASHEARVEIPLRAGLALAAATPNPATRIGAVRVTLPDAAPATLELIDVRGRRLGAREVGTLGAGTHHVALPAPAALGAGVYFVRLTRAGEERTLRWAFAP